MKPTEDDRNKDTPGEAPTSDFQEQNLPDDGHTAPIPPEDRLDAASEELPGADHQRRLAEAAGLPEQIDKYRIVSELGEGGFGVVYLAEQSEPVKRQVALKVIRFGMDSGPILARFEAERQALAMLNHPGIAKIFDAGRSGEGKSWFAMEYVQGKPIDHVLDECAASLEQRIQIMIRVCEAVQHAHSKGVIHRDLKPGNILVADDEGGLTSRIIDFGIAKAIDPEFDSGVVTEEGQFLGTPGYMSPEQTGHDNLDIDARTDVYALGAILYQVLCGMLPLPREKIVEARKAGGFVGVTMLIREFQPVRPSSRYEAMESLEPIDAERIADRRGTEPRRLERRLRGDLDWIVLRCLETDRDRRYETPAAIADDLRRHLEDLPISAGPPSTAYQLQKFIRRNRSLTIGAAAVFVVLVAGLVTSLALLSRALDAENVAGVERDTAFQMLNALTEGVRAADPSHAGEEGTIGELYRSIAEKIERGTLGNRPRDAAMLLLAFSQTSYNLNDYDAAAEYAGRVIALGDGENGVDEGLLAEAHDRLTQAKLALGETSSIDVAIDSPKTVPELMQAQYVAWNLGDYDLAAWYLGQVFEGLGPELERDQGAWDPYATAAEYQARLLADRGYFEEAEAMLKEADRVRSEYGHEENEGLTQWDAGTQLAHGAILRASGEFEAAAKNLARAADMYESLHAGEDRFMVNLAQAEHRTAEIDAARLADKEGALLESYPDLGMMEVVLLRNRARAWQRLGRTLEAAQLFEQALVVEEGMDEIYRHPGHTRRVWARLRAQDGDYTSARGLLELAFVETGSPIEESTRPELLMDRAVIAALEGQLGLAHDLAQRALAIREDSLPRDAWPLEVARVQAALLSSPNDPGRREDARRLIQQLRGNTPAAVPAADRLDWLLYATENLESQ